MGGKEAKERRRLKRLALQEQEALAGGGGATAAPSSKSDTASSGDSKPRPPPAKKMKPSDGSINTPSSASADGPKQHGQGNAKKGKFGGKNNKFGGKQSSSTGKQQQNNGKKKFKKPKHLKRKLEALSGDGGADEEKERIRLQQQMRQLEQNKAERAKRFETKIKNLAGEKFDPEVFAELTAKGASKETIHKILVEGEKIKREKSGDKNSSNKKQKKGAAKAVDTNEAKNGQKKDNEHETPSESSSPSSDSEDSGSDISLEDMEDISDEECDVYILDPEEVAKKKQKTSQIQKKSKEDESDSSESDDSSSDSGDENGNTVDQDGTMEVGQEKTGISDVKEKSGWSDSDDKSSSSSASDEDSTSGSSSDNDSDLEEQDARQKRTRGRGRKGRRDADTKRETANAEVQETKKVAAKEAEAAAAKSPPAKEKKKRRCIGRKPVTDFVVGQKYDGEVVYVKPFGAFIDIGCHSDAFCHISRVVDDYVESIEDVLSPGDKVCPRVVEIDRKQKRLTVSLQSSARIVDEKKSIEDRKQRLKKNSAKEAPRAPSSGTNSGGGRRDQPTAERQTSRPSRMEVEQPQPVTESQGQFDNLESIPESEMTPAQLKRARKLARRAERRQQQELTGLSA
jgi:predicted RNA-binding protein with RPS1 domain